MLFLLYQKKKKLFKPNLVNDCQSDHTTHSTKMAKIHLGTQIGLISSLLIATFLGPRFSKFGMGIFTDGGLPSAEM